MASLVSIEVTESVESSRRCGGRDANFPRIVSLSDSDESMRTCEGRDDPDGTRSGRTLLSDSDDIIRAWRIDGRECPILPVRCQLASDSDESFRTGCSRLRFPDHSKLGDDTGDGTPSRGGEGSPTVTSSNPGEPCHPGSGVDNSDLAMGSGVDSSERGSGSGDGSSYR